MADVMVRPYQQGDDAGIYAVCVETAEMGEPSRLPVRSRILVPLVFAGPYLEIQPEFAFVLADDRGVAGYVLGALDSPEFFRRWEMEWTPRYATEFPDAPDNPDGRRDPVDWLRAVLHHPVLQSPLVDTDEYPSHLHIDLLPRVRGAGHGSRLLATLSESLRLAGSRGMQLGVASGNSGARQFYAANGFGELSTSDGTVVMARSLS